MMVMFVQYVPHQHHLKLRDEIEGLGDTLLLCY